MDISAKTTAVDGLFSSFLKGLCYLLWLQTQVFHVSVHTVLQWAASETDQALPTHNKQLPRFLSRGRRCSARGTTPLPIVFPIVFNIVYMHKESSLYEYTHQVGDYANLTSGNCPFSSMLPTTHFTPKL